jgi:ring-1,2-phenylacetyl-CoA epoxidase subunit PaaB
MIESLDPRITRAAIDDNIEFKEYVHLDEFETYEVFHQKKRGQQHVHAGIVHAPDAELALIYAKEQFARRGQTSNLWVVASKHVAATEYSDDDIFTTTEEKLYRDPASYKVMDRIKAYKEKHNLA